MVINGAQVHLTIAHLKKSVNYRQMLDGIAYPLHYNTLFAELRRSFDGATRRVQKGAVTDPRIRPANVSNRRAWPTRACGPRHVYRKYTALLDSIRRGCAVAR